MPLNNSSNFKTQKKKKIIKKKRKRKGDEQFLNFDCKGDNTKPP
jgi:hypothetical protein